VLVEGRPAWQDRTGKAARCLNRELIRLQCYEGWTRPRPLRVVAKHCSTPDVKKIATSSPGALDRRAVDRIAAQEDAFFRALHPAAAVLQAISSAQPVVLLIDRWTSPTRSSSFLLEVLSDFQVSIPSSHAPGRHIPSCS